MTKAEEKFPDIIDTLRERLHLKPDDTSEDETIAKYSPEKAFDEICYWNFGDDWSSEIMSWLKNCGFEVKKA